MNHIGADLIPPACLDVLAAQLEPLHLTPFGLDLQQLRTQYAHRGLAVLQL